MKSLLESTQDDLEKATFIYTEIELKKDPSLNPDHKCAHVDCIGYDPNLDY